MKKIYGIDEEVVTIAVTGKTGDDSGFSLQDWMDNLYKEKKRRKSWQVGKGGNVPAHAVLFGIENENAENQISKWILSEWKIVYNRQEEWMAAMRKNDIRGTS
jgi:hypothetical protein